MGPLGGANFRSCSPLPDISSYWETTDTGLVHRAVCLFTFQPKLVFILQNYKISTNNTVSDAFTTENVTKMHVQTI